MDWSRCAGVLSLRLEVPSAVLLRSLAISALMLISSGGVMAGPVVCSTTLEALDPAEASEPVEVTTCEPIETTTELLDRRVYTWTASYAGGVDLMHQITDLFGVSLAGADGNRVMGFGFPDQTIIWDGSAVQNTVEVLQEEQSPPLPIRTADLPNGFDTSLALEQSTVFEAEEVVEATFPGVTPLW